MKMRRWRHLCSVIVTALCLSGCANLNWPVAVPDIQLISVSPREDRDAFVQVRTNKTWWTYRNITLSCDFRNSSGKVVTKIVFIKKISNGEIVNIHSDHVAGVRDIEAKCWVAAEEGNGSTWFDFRDDTNVTVFE